MKILVTGATGFVGSVLVEKLINAGHEVVCLSRKTSDVSKLNQYSGIKIWVGDLIDAASINGIADGVDYVIHLAAKGDVAAVGQKAYSDFVKMNGTGTENLLNECKGSKTLKKFVHFSSTAAMGIIGNPILNENSIPNPQSPYQRSKLKSEQVVLEANKQYGIPTVIVRPCMIYGEGGNKGEFYKFCKLMKKSMFPKVGHGKNLTPMVYVTDVADAAILAMEKGKEGNVYIIADNTSYPMDDIRNEIVKNLKTKTFYPYIPTGLALLGAVCLEKIYTLLKRAPIVTYKNIKSTVIDRTFDISKAKKDLGYEPKIHMQEGIKLTITWLKQNNAI